MLDLIRIWALQISRPAKRFLVFLIDLATCFISTWIAFVLRFDIWVNYSEPQWMVFGFSALISLPIFIHYGLYRAIFRFTGWPALLAMTRALIVFFSIVFLLFTVYGVQGVPRSMGILQPIIFIFGIGLNRSIIRFLLNDRDKFNAKNKLVKKVLIIGVSSQARNFASRYSREHDNSIMGFIDESNSLIGNTIFGLPVLSSDSLEKVLQEQSLEEIHLFDDGISRVSRNKILQLLGPFPYVRFISHNPFISNVNIDNVNASEAYKIDELLGRDQVTVDNTSIRLSIKNKVVLITGAGGSIGSELCRQIINYEPKILLLIENSEHALYRIYEELTRESNLKNLFVNTIPTIASVSNETRMRELFFSWKPDVVFHAAAYKHVPLVESNPAEAIVNNVQGTLVCASLAIEFGVSRFILVSTDKAVRPTNIMGASKRLAEMLLQALSDKSKHQQRSILSMVRFGNVLGSSGSVVPLFARQIATGGPITVTHPEVTRYFMSIPEASRLVIQASILGKGGEVFLLEMGDSVRIIDLAKRMITLSGKSLRDEVNISGDIEIEFSGLRPGEKLYEELLIGANPVVTDHPKIMMATENFLPWSELEPKLARLFDHCKEGNIGQIKSMLSEVVYGYEPHPDIVDLTYLERS
jgi:FlaA1/EpsC-like NDP-sugar epimerase